MQIDPICTMTVDENTDSIDQNIMARYLLVSFYDEKY